MQGFPRLFAGPRRRLMLKLLANGVAQAGTAFAVAWLLREALAGVGISASGPAPDPRVVGGLVACGAALLLLRSQERVDAERLGQDYVMKVRLRLFERIAARPSRDENAERYGLVMSRMITDLNALRNWVSVGVARAAVAALSLLGILAAFLWFDPIGGTVALSVCLLCALSTLAITPYLRNQVRESRRRRGRLANNLGEKVFAFGTVRHHGRTPREVQRLRVQSRRMTDALVRRMRAAGLLRALPDAAYPLAAAGLVLLLSFGSAAPGGELVVTMLLLGMLMAALRDLLRAWDYRMNFEEGRRRIGEVLVAPRVRQARRAKPLDGAGPLGLEYRHVGVANALAEVSLSAAPGERVLVSGPHGSGKSTLLGLAARLFDPDEGQLLLDGKPLRKLTLASVQEAVRLVSPELPLLRGTIGENVAYGIAGEELERVAAAAAQCGLDADEDLPEGLDTRLQEQGRNLPAGLRARVSLARALVAHPRLLLIDDPIFVSDDEARTALCRALETTDATVLLAALPGGSLLPVDREWQLLSGRVTAQPGLPPVARQAAVRQGLR